MTEARPLRSYGRRKGKALSARKERLLDELLPRLRPDLTKPPPVRLAALFDAPVKEVWLEIGFGSGEHLLWHAKRHPEIGFIDCEPFINGVASLLGQSNTAICERSACMTGMLATCSLGCPPDRSAGCFFSSPTRGPRNAS